MMAFIRSTLSIIIATAAILFALGNREIITVRWSPLHDALHMPSFLLFFAGILLGFLIGGVLVWFNGTDTRHQNKMRKKTIKKLEEELEQANITENITIEPNDEKGGLFSFLERPRNQPQITDMSHE